MIPFWDAAAERAFQLHYAGQTVPLQLVASTMGLFVLLASLLKALLFSKADAASLVQLWVRIAYICDIFVVVGILGLEGHTLCMGPYSVWKRLVLATGLGFYLRPVDCSFYCGLLWRHRLLTIHVVTALVRTPAMYYWIGGVVCHLAAAAVEVADRTASCDHSLSCLLSRFKEAADSPSMLLQRIALTAAGNSKLFLVDVALPGLVLSWYELRARRGWLRLQLQQRRQQQQQQHWWLQRRRQAAVLGRTTPAAPQKLEGQQLESADSTRIAAPECKQQELEQASCATDGTTAAAGAARIVAQQQDDASCSQPLPGPGNSSVLDLATVTAGATGAATCSQAAPAAEPAGSPKPAAGPALQRTQRRHDALYRSPLHSFVVSCKADAPHMGTDDLRRFQSQLAAAVRAAAQAAVQTHPQSSNQAVFVTNAAAFPGCLQVVLQLALLHDGQMALLQQQLQLQHDLQHAVQQVLANWPNCRLLHVQQLGQEQARDPCTLPSISVAAETGETAPAVGAAPWPGIEQGADAYGGRSDTSSSSDAAGGPRCTRSPATPGVYLQPVALALPGSTGSHELGVSPTGASSSACNGRLFTVPSAELWIPQPVVRQLQQAGHSCVRVVVTAAANPCAAEPQVPSVPPLLDQTWILPTAAPGAPAGPAGDVTCADTPAPCDIEKAMHMQLQFGREGMHTLLQHQAATVLTVVVLAGRSSAAHKAGQAAAAAAAATATEPEESHIAASCVVANLPLLVLPAAACSELQQLFTAAVQDGLDCSAAYWQLHPLLRDLAIAICTARTGGTCPATGGSGDDEYLLQPVLDALAEIFIEHGCLGCLQLLAAAAAAATESGPHIAVDNEPTATSATMHDSAAPAPQGQLEATAARPATAGTGAQVTPASSNSGSYCSSGVDSFFEPVCIEASSAKLDGNKEGDASSLARPAAAATTPAARLPFLQGFDAHGYPSSAFEVCWRTLLFGFPEAAVEAAYLSYKGVVLRQQDFWSMVVFAMGLVLKASQLALLVYSSTANSQQLFVAATRLLYTAVHTATRALVWAAATTSTVAVAGSTADHWWGGWLAKVQQRRGAVLSAGVLFMVCFVLCGLLSGGVWAAGSLEAYRAYQSSQWVFCAYRHVVEPLQVRAVLVPTTVVYLAAQVLLLDPVSSRPQLLGLGAVCTAAWVQTVLLCVVHMVVAARVELSMRRSFARQLGQSAG